MRILLVHAPHRDTFGYSMPPPGLLRLGGELERLGLDVELEDLAYRLAAGELHGELTTACARHLERRGSFDAIGFSTMGATLPAALAIGRALHERHPGTRFVVGGPGTTGVDTTLLARFTWLDAVVRGEAERSLPELLERWSTNSDPAGVRGITWRRSGGDIVREADGEQLEDLTRLAPYARHLLPALTDYKRLTGESEGLTPIDSGRGCVYDCSFCTIGRFWSRRSRVLPAAKLADEVQALRELPGARNAYLCHDLFGANRDQALAFCTEMIRRGPMPWECRARVDHLDELLLGMMSRAGCYRVLLGVESGAASVRARCEKSMRQGTDVLEVVRSAATHGITPILSLILGLPGEGAPELEASLDLCLRASLAASVNLSLHLPNPQPGCALSEELGAESRPIAGIPPDMAFGAGESKAERELIAAHPDLFSTWSLLPGDEGELRRLAILARELPLVFMRYPRTWALLQRELGLPHAEIFELWHAGRESFDWFVRSANSALCLDALRWEQALLRAAASPAPAPKSHRELIPRASAERLQLDYDLPRIAEALAKGEEIDDTPALTKLYVHATASGARTSRAGPDVDDVLRLIDGSSSVAQLEARNPGLSGALESLARAGLVTFEAH